MREVPFDHVLVYFGVAEEEIHRIGNEIRM